MGREEILGQGIVLYKMLEFCYTRDVGRLAHSLQKVGRAPDGFNIQVFFL